MLVASGWQGEVDAANVKKTKLIMSAEIMYEATRYDCIT